MKRIISVGIKAVASTVFVLIITAGSTSAVAAGSTGVMGALSQCSFFGGADYDGIEAMAVSQEGYLYVAGYTDSVSIGANGYQTANSGESDAFVAGFDPGIGQLLSATFLGGSGSDYAHDIAIAPDGSVYVTGATWSGDFPVTGGCYDGTYNTGCDAFVARLDSGLQNLLGSTYLGGFDEEKAYGLALDGSGNVFVTGYASDGASWFPTTPGAYERYGWAHEDIFVSKLNSVLTTLPASTLLPADDQDVAYDITCAPDGSVYITGKTYSEWLPTTPGAYDRIYNGSMADAFVARFSNDLSSLIASTYLGGAEYEDWGTSILLNSDGNPVVAGITGSGDFPVTPAAYDSSYNGNYDFFVSMLDAQLQGLAASTFLGGAGEEGPTGGGYHDDGPPVTIGSDGHIYLAGDTGSADFPVTADAPDGAYSTQGDAVLTKLTGNLQGIAYSTFLGGVDPDAANAVAVNGDVVYLAGRTASDATDGFPVTSGAYDTNYNGGVDAFIARFDSGGDDGGGDNGGGDNGQPDESLPLILRLNKTSFSRADRIVVYADAAAVSNAVPYARFVMPDGSNFYITTGGMRSGSPSPYIGRPITLGRPVSGRVILDLSFSVASQGDYRLQGAFLSGGSIMGSMSEVEFSVQ